MNMVKTRIKIGDLYYAAFLKTAGFELVEMAKDKNRKLFVFEDSNGLIQKVQTEYVNGTSKVSAKDLIDNIRALKTLINMD